MLSSTAGFLTQPVSAAVPAETVAHANPLLSRMFFWLAASGILLASLGLTLNEHRIGKALTAMAIRNIPAFSAIAQRTDGPGISLKKTGGSAVSAVSGGSRFDAMLDQLTAMGNLSQLRGFLDLPKEDEDSSPLENVLQGSMNLVNIRAQAVASELRDARSGIDAARVAQAGFVRMPVVENYRRDALDISSLGMAADMSSVRMPLAQVFREAAKMVAEQTEQVDPSEKSGVTSTGKTPAESQKSVEVAALSPSQETISATPTPDAPRIAADKGGPAGSVSEPPAIKAGLTPSTRTQLRHVKYGMLPVSGALSAVFESGTEGIAAIGFDRRGGTSYGKYQIASRTGTMKQFIGFLQNRRPDWAARLDEAGPHNTGSRRGELPSEWRRIAREEPEHFERIQDEFILRANYTPALQNILEETGVNIGELSPAVREVLWSTAVQHGSLGAARIFISASKKTDPAHENFDRLLIEQVYTTRKSKFYSSPRSIQQAVRARLNREMNMALTLLEKVAENSVSGPKKDV